MADGRLHDEPVDGAEDLPGAYVAPGLVQVAPFQVARRPGLVMAAGIGEPYGVFIGTTVDGEWLRAALDDCTA